MKTTLKNILFLIFVGLMIFVRSAGAQNVLTIQGNVSDVNGLAIANQMVIIMEDSSNTVNPASTMVNTDAQGNYSVLLTVMNMQGALNVMTSDCNGLSLINSHFFTPNITTITSDFIICSTPCNMIVTVHHDTLTNVLTPTTTGGTPPYSYSYNNGWMPPYYYTPGWCLIVVDATGCTVTICDSSSVNQSCIDSFLLNPNVVCPMVYNPVCGCDSVTYNNVCEAENYGGVTSWTQGPCGSVNPSNCYAGFQSYNIGINPAAVPVVIQFNDFSVGNITNWIWDFGDGNTGSGQNPVHSYQVPGIYYACLTIEELDSVGNILCTDTYCDSVWADTISILPPSCYADFVSTQVAVSDSTHFMNLSLGISNTTSYYWDFGDGNTSTDENPVHLYAQSGWYYVCLTIVDSANNCYDTYCDYLNIVIASTGSCQAYFYSMPALIQVPNSFTFYDVSAGNANNWLWDFGDGNTSTLQTPTHTYTNTSAAFYLVCLTIEEVDPITGNVLCTDTYCDSIYVGNNVQSCQASFSGIDLGNNEAMFLNSSYPQTGNTLGLYNYVDIDFGDGTIDYNIGSSVNHTYASPGTYYVCITVTSMDSSLTTLCTDTYCDSITVTSGSMPCQASFCWVRDTSWVNNGSGIWSSGNVFSFCDLSTPIGMVQSWQWDMGDNGSGQYLQGTSSTSQMPIYEFDTNGVYNVCLTIVTNGGLCTSTTCDSVDFSMMMGQTSIDEVVALEGVKLYPNPVKDNLSLDLTANKNGDLSIRVINMVGQVLLNEEKAVLSGAINHNIDVSNIANGIYSVEVILDGEKQYKRVVIGR